MPRQTTRAVNRALTYAIESAEGDSRRLRAIRADFDRMLESDLPEATIVFYLSVIPIRIAQMTHLRQLADDPKKDPETVYAYATELQLQIDAGHYAPID